MLARTWGGSRPVGGSVSVHTSFLSDPRSVASVALCWPWSRVQHRPLSLAQAACPLLLSFLPFFLSLCVPCLLLPSFPLPALPKHHAPQIFSACGGLCLPCLRRCAGHGLECNTGHCDFSRQPFLFFFLSCLPCLPSSFAPALPDRRAPTIFSACGGPRYLGGACNVVLIVVSSAILRMQPIPPPALYLSAGSMSSTLS